MNMKVDLLKEKWMSLVSRLNGDMGSAEEIFGNLVQLYTQEHRKYHTLEHIEHMLVEFDGVKELARNPEAIEFAIWFHDAVYDTRAKDNEAKSAELAMEATQKMGLPEKFAKKVSRLILATEHKYIPQDIDAQIVIDLDLASLALEPTVFDRNSANIRFEYGWVPEKIFNPKRAEFAEGMLKRPQIYSLQSMREKYEAKARANLERHIAELTA